MVIVAAVAPVDQPPSQHIRLIRRRSPIPAHLRKEQVDER
jgi:hypothetical protein